MRSRLAAGWGTNALWLLTPYVLGLATVTLTACILVGTGRGAGERVYSVAQVTEQLHHDPATWTGRTLWVRGQIAGCPSIVPAAAHSLCQGWNQYFLMDAAAPATQTLPVEWGNPGPLLATLRRLPLLGRLLPAPQGLHWGVEAAYRVHLSAMSTNFCGTGVCYKAVLLDAAPNSL